LDATGKLSVNYSGISFVGVDEVVIEICDVAGSCVQQTIRINIAGDVTVYNALSPNGDGKNDTFYLEFINMIEETRDNRVTIYNRWGALVFEVANYDNTTNVFAGKSNDGKDLPSGTYYYKIVFASGRETQSGYIALKR